MSDSSSRPKHHNTTLPFVSVVMPAHNEEQYITQCLQSLKNQDYPADKFEIIVVDNNSTDRTAELARSCGATVLFKEKGPVGSVRNHGAKQSRGEIIAFIDSDCIAPVNWLSKGTNLLTTNMKHVFGGGYTLRQDPYWIEKYWLLEGQDGPLLPKDLLGGSIMIYKSTFEEVGMFSESITSGEDTKLAEDLRLAGNIVKTVADLNVAHLGNPTNSTAFFKRQIWHSENYLKNLNASLRDPVFYLVVLFTSLALAGLLAMPFKPHVTTTLWTGALLLPCILSIKRILRARYKLKSPQDVIYIYWLDLLYASGRSVGLLKGITNALKK